MSDSKNQNHPKASGEPSASSDFHRSLFEEAPEGFFVTDPEGRLAAVNLRATEITGYSREELLGLNFTDLIPPEDLARDPIRLDELRQGGIVIKERRIRRKDGSLLPVEVSARRLPGGNLLGQVRDTTERKQAEAMSDQRSRELAALQALGLAVSTSLSIERTAAAALRGMLEAVEPDLAFLFLREGDRLILQGVLPPEARQVLGAVPEHRVGECICGLAVREGRPIYSRDIRYDGRCTWNECKQAGIRSFAALPVRTGEEIIGVIGLASRKELDFEDRSDFLETLAHQVSVAMSNAQLFEAARRELSERQQAEQKLRENEEKYRRLIETTGTGYVILDEQGRVIDANQEYAQLTGRQKLEEVIGHNVLEWTVPHDIERNAEEVRKCVDRGFVRHLEIEYLTPSGQIVPVEINASVLRASGTLRILSLCRDIAERQKAQDLARASENLISSIVRAAPTGIGVVSNRILLAVNDQICRMIGYNREELIGRSARVLYPTDADFEYVGTEKYRQISEHGAGTVETRWQSKDGRIIDILMSSAPVNPADHAAGVTFTALDISERKKAEAEKDALQFQLLQAQKMESVGRLAGGVAHDFNNMLAAILGQAELAMMQCTPSEPIHSNLKAIQNAAQRSTDLVRQLLAFARKQTVTPRVLDLNDTVAGMLKMLRRLIGEDIDLVWMPGPDLWPVKMDPSQIDQLLANLCVNARDAIVGVGKVTIETENTTFDEAYCAIHPGFACGQYVLLAVSDDGCGMSPEVLAQLFEPFFTTKEVGKGTGLGLATVYGIVKQNEGFANVYSEPGKGTTLKIYLPRFAGEALSPTTESTAETPQGRGETVLLVEDEAAILNVGRVMLERMGYTVLTAPTPGEALRLVQARAEEIQLLISDVVMPEMNGRELAKLISDLKPGLKCLFISGYTADVIAHRGVLDQGVAFLQKPFSMKDLAFKVRQALDRERENSY